MRQKEYSEEEKKNQGYTDNSDKFIIMKYASFGQNNWIQKYNRKNESPAFLFSLSLILSCPALFVYREQKKPREIGIRKAVIK